MMILAPLKRRFELYVQNETGASAIEAALCFPIVLMLMFGCFQYGLFYNNATELNHNFQEASRQVKLMTDPSDNELLSLYQGKYGYVNPQDIALSVSRVNRYGESFAEVNMTYSYVISIPLLPKYAVTSSYKNLVLISSEI